MKIFTIFLTVLIVTIFTSPLFAIEYCTDFLESGNAGGWGNSLKTFDDEWTMNENEEVNMDIWLNDCPQSMLTAGFWITFDPSLLAIVDVLIYNDEDLPGPWDSQLTVKLSEPEGSGTYFVALGQFNCVDPDTGGDMILGRVQFYAEANGTPIIEISPVPAFDTVVGCSGNLYDSQIPVKTVNSQMPCTLTIFPSLTTVLPGGTIQFQANEYGRCNHPCYTWEIAEMGSTASTINGYGLYNAGASIGSDTITVTDVCNDDLSDSAIVNVVSIITTTTTIPRTSTTTTSTTTSIPGPSTTTTIFTPEGMGYSIDILEPGNPGGWFHSLKTFDDNWSMTPGEEVDIDIWLNDLPLPIITAGLWIVYGSAISIQNVQVYDSSDLPGPWDPGFTGKVPEPGGPGTYMVSVGNFATVAPDSDGDILIARIRFGLASTGDAHIGISTVPGFDCVVGDTTVFDPEVEPTTITINQRVDSCCYYISPDPVPIVWEPYQLQFLLQRTGVCNPPDLIWSEDCQYGEIDQNGLFTATHLPESFEHCSVCVTDTVNTSSCTDSACNPPADCCAEVIFSRYGNIYTDPDRDNDGIINDEDRCPESNLEETLILDNCDSGVENLLLDEGCTMFDLIGECEIISDGKRGRFASCVAKLTNEWKTDGLISGEEKGSIQRCLGHSNTQ